jgi:hypothetical protein
MIIVTRPALPSLPTSKGTLIIPRILAHRKIQKLPTRLPTHKVTHFAILAFESAISFIRPALHIYMPCLPGANEGRFIQREAATPVIFGCDAFELGSVVAGIDGDTLGSLEQVPCVDLLVSTE